MKLLDRMTDVRPLRSSAAFRRLWVSGIGVTLGHQLAVVAVLAQVWELTGSSVAVGAIGLAQALPMVMFGLVGGTLADAVDRRTLVVATTSGQFLAAVLLAAQAFAGVGSLWLVLVLVGAQSGFQGLGAPARKTFVVGLLPADEVAAGLALTNLSFQAAMLAGPALGGVLTAHGGAGLCYAVDAVTLLVGIYGIVGLPSLRPAGGDSRPGLRTTREGLRYVLRGRVVGGAVLTDLLSTLTAMPVALFPAVNAERFGGAPETLGLFLSAIAVGGVAAGSVSGLFSRARRVGLAQLLAAGVWGLALAGFGLAGSLWLTLGCLAVAGAADTVAVVTRGALVQLAVPDSHRGRVSAVEHVVGVAGPDLGNFRGGLVAGATSATFAAVSGGLLCVAGIAVLAATNRPLRRFTIPGPGPHTAPDDTDADGRSTRAG